MGKWCARAKAETTQPKNKPKVTAKAQGATKGNNSSVLLPIRAGGKSPDATSQPGSTALEVSASAAGLGKFSQAAQTLDAAQGLLIAIASFVRIDDAIFDQILDLMADVLVSNAEARSALEALNADAVWLHLYEQAAIELPRQPSMARVRFVKIT